MTITPRSRDVLRCAAPSAAARPTATTGQTPPFCTVPDLAAELKQLLAQIPAGRVSTYGDVARALGDVKAARWVGEYLLKHAHDEDCGCHRVVRKGGEVGLYITGNPQEKITRLEAEGVVVCEGRVELSGPLLTEFTGPAPLESLRRLQEALPQRVQLIPLGSEPHSVAGIDVSYTSAHEGVAAYVRMDTRTHEVLYTTCVEGPVRFPYIPGYLTFRELPLFERLFEAVRRAGQEAPVTLVDGNGILHPRRAGSASALGVAVETPTIGITKKLLCGSVDLAGLAAGEMRDVVYQDEPIGVALRAGRSHRPFFASPGHRVDPADTVAIVQQVLGSGRLPVPIALADRISRDHARRLKGGGAADDQGVG